VRPEDILQWLQAQPFRPFRITMNSGRAIEVRHPELVRVLRTSLMVFRPTEQADVYERWDMFGLVLIENIAPIDAPAAPAPPDGAGSGVPPG
jgi:hypothetical protein